MHSFLFAFPNSSLINTPLKLLILSSLHISIISKLLNGSIVLKPEINSSKELISGLVLKKDHFQIYGQETIHCQQYLNMNLFQNKGMHLFQFYYNHLFLIHVF